MIRQYRIYLKEIRSAGLRFWLHCLLTLISLVSSITSILLFSELIDAVSRNSMDTFRQLLPLTILVVMIGLLTDYFSERIIIHLQAQLGASLRYRMQRSQLYAKTDSASALDSGKILTTYKEQTDTIIDYMKSIQGYLICPLTILLACIYFISIHPLLFAASIILMPLSSILYGRLSVPIQKKRKEIVEKKACLTEQTNDVMSGYLTMKAGCHEQYFIDTYEQQVNKILQTEKEIERINSTLGRFFILIRYIPQLIIPLFGGFLAYRGSITIGELTAAGMIASYIFNPLQKLLEMKKGERILQPAFTDVNQILELSQEDDGVVQTERRKRFTKKLEFKVIKSEYKKDETESQGNKPESTEDRYMNQKTDTCSEILSLNNVSFAYEQGKPILDHLMFSMNQKEHIVLIGESGSGKSTLIKAVCGMLSGYEGEICIKNQIMTEKNLSQLRSLISYVPQTIYLFCGTIAENIAMSSEYNIEDVIHAARLAMADEFIQNLPDGYKTMTGDQGITLSLGQMQRIAIARGIYRNCELFLLDEPTASVDEKNSRAIMESLHDILKDKSSIIITHRMDVIAKEDKVLSLKGGVLYEV